MEQSSKEGKKAPEAAHEEGMAHLQREESKKEKFSKEGLSKAHLVPKSKEISKKFAPEY
jgi:hypothetical protein